MRLQLIAAIVAAATPALAQEAGAPGSGEAAGRLLVYSDDDATSVVTSVLDAEAALGAGLSAGAHVLVDSVSSASVDVVSAATGRWDEIRVELGARLGARVAGTGLSAGYTRSEENDWQSDALSVGADRELFQRNTRVAISYGLGLNQVGRAMDPTFERSLDSHSVEVSVSQLIDEQTRLGAAASAQVLSGFLSSPYRFVEAADGSRGPERHPDSRLRRALSAHGVRSLLPQLAAHLSYRVYSDDWGVVSHTASAQLVVEHGRWLGRLEGRYYWQDRADFYRETYETSFRFMTADRELATFWDAGGSAQVAARLGPVTADLKLGAVHYRFKNFAALPRRTAVLAGGGARLAW